MSAEEQVRDRQGMRSGAHSEAARLARRAGRSASPEREGRGGERGEAAQKAGTGRRGRPSPSIRFPVHCRGAGRGTLRRAPHTPACAPHNAPRPWCASLPHQLAGPRVCAPGRERGLGGAEEREPRPRGAQQSPERLSTSHSPGPQKIAAKAESSS